MLQYELSYIKQHYGVLFRESQEEIEKGFLALRNEFACPVCGSADTKPETPLDMLHPGCGYQYWQKACLAWLEQEYGRKLVESSRQMQQARDAVSCHHCGVCCRFASSEFSYAELLEKADAGDEFARQFTSVFLPYADADAARKRFPELVDDILKEVRLQQQASGLDKSPANPSDQADVHFYHCPYIGEDNLCTLYGKPKRPDICQSYPDTPLTFIYKKCAWKPWKDTYHQKALKTHGAIEIALFYASRLRELFSSGSP